MSEDGIIKVLFGVDGSSLDRGLNAATGRIAKFSNDVNKRLVITASELARTIKSIVTAIPESINQTAKSLGDLYDKAQNLKIVTDRLVELRAAAEKAGVSGEGLNQTLSILKQRIGAGLGGDKGVTDALKEIGLSAEKLKGLSLDQQFLKIAQGIKGISDANRQSDLSNSLLGRGGKESLGLINSDIQGAIDKYKALGLAISDADRAAADSFDESNVTLGKVFDGIREKIVVKIAPELEKVVVKFTDWITAAGGVEKIADRIAKSFMSWGTALSNTVSAISSIVQGIHSAQQGLDNFAVSQQPGNKQGVTQDILNNPISSSIKGYQNLFNILRRPQADLIKIDQLGNTNPGTNLKYNTSGGAGNSISSRFGAFTSVSELQVIDVQKEAFKKLSEVTALATTSLENFKAKADGTTSAFSQTGQLGGQEQISRILGLSEASNRPVATSEDFDRTAADIVDKIIGGVDANSADIQSPLAFLKNESSISYDGQNHGAQKQALLEIYKLIEDKKPQQVDVNLKVQPTPYAFIEWANDPKSRKTIFGATESETAALASAVAGRT